MGIVEIVEIGENTRNCGRLIVGKGWVGGNTGNDVVCHFLSFL